MVNKLTRVMELTSVTFQDREKMPNVLAIRIILLSKRYR